MLIPTFRVRRPTYREPGRLLPCDRSFSVDPLLLVPIAGQLTGTPKARFFFVRTQFSSFLSHRNTDSRRPRSFGRPRALSDDLLRRTHFYSFRLIDESARGAPSFHRFHWAPRRYWNSGSTAKGRTGVLRFGQHRDPVGAQIAEEPGRHLTGGGPVADQSPSSARRLRRQRPGRRPAQFSQARVGFLAAGRYLPSR